jgi:hypothetical protein
VVDLDVGDGHEPHFGWLDLAVAMAVLPFDAGWIDSFTEDKLWNIYSV